MVIAWVVVLVALVGLVMYVLPGNGERKEIGRLMFFAGLLVALFMMGGRTVRLP